MKKDMFRTTAKVFLIAAFASLGLWSQPAPAEVTEVRLAQQFGINYLPLTIMAEKKLLEQEGKKLGLDLTTEWIRFTGGPPMNEALISGNLDFASGGVSPMVTIWARTQGNLKVKGICAINSMPLSGPTCTSSSTTSTDSARSICSASATFGASRTR